MHLNELASEVKEGIIAAGGTPFEFNTIAVCDGLAMGHEGMRYSLPSREIIADSVEIMVQAHRLDGFVMVSNCDKVTPGMLMAAAGWMFRLFRLRVGRWLQDGLTERK